MMIDFISMNSGLVPLIEGQTSSDGFPSLLSV